MKPEQKHSKKEKAAAAAVSAQGLLPIPQPSTAPVVGNLTSIDLEDPSRSFSQLAARYGPIYKLAVPGLDMIIVSNWKLVNEACDDSRFQKSLKGDLEELRTAVHDGLFTSKGEEEENWGVAHRVLVSAFGPLAIRGMFDEMHEIVSQLVLKWARQGPSARIDVGEDFTRLTLDTVALTSMGFRFNSYYQSEMHPFITAMYEVLNEVAKKGMRFLPSVFYTSESKKYHKNIQLLRRTAREVIEERKANPDGFKGRKDLLTAMTEGVDPRTGRKMTEESVIDNLITFLVAGHETTAATLQFTMYNLLKHPDKYHKLQEEIDSVVGTGPISLAHVTKLKYLDACIRETLRLSAPIWAFGREPLQDEVLGEKYLIKKDQQIVCLLAKSHRDPEVWGPDADEFVPERMLDGGFDRIQEQYPHSWSPFGTGMRSCIGRAFAWQEMLLAYAALLQSFSFVMDNPSYTLQTQTSLTIRPKGFYIRAIARGGLTPLQLEARLVGASGNGADAKPSKSASAQPKPAAASENGEMEGGQRLAIYYGSNSGTCEFMARRLGTDASDRGFVASIEPLDVAKGALPKEVPVVIVASSYEGQPTHNAGHFVQWIESLSNTKELEGVSYAVWGCGHSDWTKTYQRIPRLLDEGLSKFGGERLVPMGETDAKIRDMFSDFETWQDETLWPAIQKKLNIKVSQDDTTNNRLKVFFSTPRTSILRPDVKEALVSSARSLTPRDAAGEEKRHLEVQLPSGWTYTAGDYLAVLPHNPKATVARVMRRLHMAWDAHVTIEAAGTTTLPTNASLPVSELLSSYVELGQVATRKDVATLSKLADDAEMKAKLEHMAADGFEEEVRGKQLSVLGILEAFPALMVPFHVFLSLLLPMRVRQYSISSSPLVKPGLASLSYGVIDRPATSGTGRHVGVASSYLASLQEGDKVQVAVRSATKGFQLPLEPQKTPIICIAAGTGLAPFRAFMQERAVLKESGAQLAPAALFYGCRDPAVDDLYRDEFDAWEAAGVVSVFRAYSRAPEQAEGCRYVQDRLWHERTLVGDLWNTEGRIYVCGANRIVEGVKQAFVRILQSENEKRGEPMSFEESLEWFEKHQTERFVRDVFD
ncbi:bifunctional P-450:NADPH-P450 reductase [Microdochium trichocladiopsis]|uniref:Bifunctional cytochrome P450/NADPH--P450 reductase n=1 Tax=Microdochium trichocladiopsis TaxID=1682393 RepID=A0A9P8Y5D9_9PEZI|nr:bifunctional P-450:NADPH-P450 reductase [Microdochium trichocladiopsis]KAH7031507.1 bifunctional P-450:NADPH-P450 reductase [Microdochium trichocladiopsis]